MSWDIFVQDLPREAKSVLEIPADFKPASVGTRSIIIGKIKQIVPTADFSDPSWGHIDGDGWSIEVNTGTKEVCDGFAFHVRGGNVAVGVIAAILQHLELRALDSQTGEFFAPPKEAIESFKNWQAYLSHVAKNGNR